MAKRKWYNQKWLEKRDYISLVAYCRTLKKKDGKTREGIAIHHFDSDSPKALREIQVLLTAAYYIILDQQGKVFGPVQCKLRKCANPNCGLELEPWGPGDAGLGKCPRCKGTTWITTSTPYLWYVTTKPVEAEEVVRRWAVNIEGTIRRFYGGDEFPELSQKLTKCLGIPTRDILDNPETRRGAYELVGSQVACPHCQEKSPADAKFCAHCGGKLLGD